MKRKALCGSMSLLVVALGSGCRMAELLRENTEGIKATNQAISGNTTAMAATTQTMQDLESTLKQESLLKRPMQDLAALGPTFNKVADLGGPMKEVAGLRDPMVQLSALQGSLDQVARLEKPMSDVARLQEPLQTVGQLSRPVSALSPSYSRATRRHGDPHHSRLLRAAFPNDMGSGPAGFTASFRLKGLPVFPA